MSKVTKLPKLYHKNKSGKIIEWQVWADGKYVCTRYGQVGGKMQTSRKASEATNKGRSNARTVEEQAKFDARSMWKNRVERKYRETPEAAKETQTLPMLAKKFDEKKTYPWPATAQPKLDGVRCVAFRVGDNGVRLQSRGGKVYHVPHIEAAALKVMKRNGVSILDGEIFAEGLTFQDISSYVKRQQADTTKLEYWVYDVPSPNAWSTRAKVLNTLDTYPGVSIVGGTQIDSLEQLKAAHNRYIQAGYEGAMLRLLEGKYEWGHRSSHLLKYKSFEDAEFKVVGAKEGKGRLEGCAVWQCETKDGTPFSCLFKGTIELRRQQWKDRKKYIGKKMTVRYANLSTEGIPRFPVGVKFRDGKDLPKGGDAT